MQGNLLVLERTSSPEYYRPLLPRPVLRGPQTHHEIIIAISRSIYWNLEWHRNRRKSEGKSGFISGFSYQFGVDDPPDCEADGNEI